MKKGIIIAVIITLVVLILLFVGVMNFEANEPIPIEQNLESGSDVEIEFSFSKEIYNTGENLVAEFSIINGDQFRNYLIKSCHFKEGINGEEICSKSTGLVPTQPEKLFAFNHSESGHGGDMFYFTNQGKYTYSVKVYDCTDIEDKSGLENCGGGKKLGIGKYEIEDAEEKYEPITSSEKIIEVIGDAIPIICQTDSDCSENCVGCKSNSFSCVLNDCKECFFGLDCKDRYKCIEYNCIPE